MLGLSVLEKTQIMTILKKPFSRQKVRSHDEIMGSTNYTEALVQFVKPTSGIDSCSEYCYKDFMQSYLYKLLSS